MKALKSYRFDEGTINVIEDLRCSLNLSNSSDVLRKAITLLKLVSDNQKKGGSVVIRLKKSEKEIVIS